MPASHNLVHELLVCRVAVQLHRQDNIFIDIQDRDKVIVLEDKTDVAAAEDGQLLVILFASSSPRTMTLAGRGRIQPAHHVKQGGFPLPDVPTIATNSPCSTERLTPSRRG